MLNCKKMGVHTFMILHLAVIFLLKTDGFNCQIDRYTLENFNAGEAFAPTSMRTVLQMIYAGSYGRTASQLKPYVIPYTIDQKTNGNSAFYGDNKLHFATNYSKVLTKYLHAKERYIPFSEEKKSERRILDWVRETAPKAANGLNGFIDNRTVAVVVHAFKFEAEFAKPFKVGSIVNGVRMLRLTDNFLYKEEAGAKLLELGFKNNPRTKMLIFQPINETQPLNEFLDQIKSRSISYYRGSLKLRKVDVFLPQIEAASRHGPKKLKIDAFSRFASLIKLFRGRQGSYISQLLQRGNIEFGPRKISIQAASVAQLKFTVWRRSANPVTYQSDPNDLPSTLPEVVAQRFVYFIINGRNILATGIVEAGKNNIICTLS